jgi:hypothetical protein
MLNWHMNVEKSEIPTNKVLKGSYFDICRSTEVGGKTTKLTPDEIFVLMLPIIDIRNVIDRCLLNEDLVIQKLLGLIFEINPDVSFDTIVNFEELRIDSPQFLLLKHKIKTSDSYDFSTLYTYINRIFKEYKTKNIDIIKKLLKINDKKGFNFLLWCFEKGKPQNFIMFLLDNYGTKCKIDQVTSTGDTALILACKRSLSDVAIKIIDTFGTECKIDQVTNTGDTALSWACRRCPPDVAIKIIDTFGADCKIDQVTSTGDTALIWACRQSLSDVAIKIIDTFGADCKIDQVTSTGDTAFWFAQKKNMVKVLIRLSP